MSIPRIRRTLTLTLTVALVTLMTVITAHAQQAAPTENERITALEQSFAQRLQQLEQRMNQRLDRLEAQIAQLSAQSGIPTEEEERTAAGVLGEANAMISAGDIDGARKKLDDLLQNHSRTRAARQARSLAIEVAVIGKAAPAALKVEKWYQGEGEGEGSLKANGATLLVFWEEWCPHCRAEVPKLEQVYDRYKAQGLHVVGLTRLTRDVTDDKLQAFLTDQHITYPVAKEDGELSREFNVRGIPAAAVVKAGKIVWRGHPARLTDAMIQGWL
jgi:thiol-disulfide isomerase/thioredoxin